MPSGLSEKLHSRDGRKDRKCPISRFFYLDVRREAHSVQGRGDSVRGVERPLHGSSKTSCVRPETKASDLVTTSSYDFFRMFERNKPRGIKFAGG